MRKGRDAPVRPETFRSSPHCLSAMNQDASTPTERIRLVRGTQAEKREAEKNERPPNAVEDETGGVTADGRRRDLITPVRRYKSVLPFPRVAQ